MTKSYLNIEDITDANYVHTKRVCKDFEIEDLGEYYDFYVRLFVRVFDLDVCIWKL